MTAVPESVSRLVEERERARKERDFARADALRDEIAAAGFVVKDAAAGVVIEAIPRSVASDPDRIPNTLGDPPVLDLSLHLLYEGFHDDVLRFLNGLEDHSDLTGVEVVIVDNGGGSGEWLEDLPQQHPAARAVHLDREVGWATARNAGLKTSRGRIIALVDLSIEPTGDIVGPLLRAFDDPSLGVAGPYGLVSDDMRSWRESPGPDVDAIEGYLLATRRDLLTQGLIHEKFRWYRNADIDLSFQLRSLGARAVVVPLSVAKHTHRGWSSLDDEERSKRSKRNHYLFFDRWKDRPDLLQANRAR